ncbi:C-signal-like [Antedon mediterranea]|uniref:C-signal-like n=1 Tax=Antedon mediterranea TaxID=105859 RepID=UPI003AF8A1F4
MNVRSVIITGANRGIGLEFVKQFVALPKPPSHLISTCRSPEQATELQSIAKSNSNVHVLQLDILSDDSINAFTDKVKNILEGQGLNLLLNNAGVHLERFGDFDKVSRNGLEQSFSAHITGPVKICQDLLPSLKAAAAASPQPGMSVSKAAIIHFSSIMASIASVGPGGPPSSYSYQVTKSAVNMLTKLMSVDLESSGILVACIHPGWVKTDMGGPNGQLTTDQSVKSLFELFSSFNKSSAGKLFSYNGEIIPW